MKGEGLLDLMEYGWMKGEGPLDLMKRVGNMAG